MTMEFYAHTPLDENEASQPLVDENETRQAPLDKNAHDDIVRVLNTALEFIRKVGPALLDENEEGPTPLDESETSQALLYENEAGEAPLDKNEANQAPLCENEVGQARVPPIHPENWPSNWNSMNQTSLNLEPPNNIGTKKRKWALAEHMFSNRQQLVNQSPFNSKAPTTIHTQINKGTRWTEEEHLLFVDGLQRYRKGDWKNISKMLCGPGRQLRLPVMLRNTLIAKLRKGTTTRIILLRKGTKREKEKASMISPFMMFMLKLNNKIK
ncbi:uncharacterized protein LOC129285420 isoform X2 [Prosopis cineraria]|uniref:uncharacterized protein LOC129285420 isoform X2 n=1 Tax=Prosopis cineraria TaxID=364024 RepID=UPI0024108EA7|nr:uncharacterized protein LOC129285420 isoform X2 [Prosopis cineraria]